MCGLLFFELFPTVHWSAFSFPSSLLWTFSGQFRMNGRGGGDFDFCTTVDSSLVFLFGSDIHSCSLNCLFMEGGRVSSVGTCGCFNI